MEVSIEMKGRTAGEFPTLWDMPMLRSFAWTSGAQPVATLWKARERWRGVLEPVALKRRVRFRKSRNRSMSAFFFAILRSLCGLLPGQPDDNAQKDQRHQCINVSEDPCFQPAPRALRQIVQEDRSDNHRRRCPDHLSRVFLLPTSHTWRPRRRTTR